MNLNIGDSIKLEFGETYLILMKTVLDEKKYYLIANEKNVLEILIVQIDGEDVKIIKDKNEAEKIVKAMKENK